MIKKILPWWLKIASKIILSRLPVPYSLWKKLGIFVNGNANNCQVAYDTFLSCANNAGVLLFKNGIPHFPILESREFKVLELGPGDSLFSGLVANALGSNKTWLVDAKQTALKDVNKYIHMSEFIETKGLKAADLSSCKDINDVLKQSSSVYLTDGVKSLNKIPDKSIDFCFSHAVLEHIDLNDFPKLVTELRRILKNTGRSYHIVDLKDHLDFSLNNLRFSQKQWEGALFKKSGFYTNRIRFSQMTTMFEEAGFKVSCPIIKKWNCLPIQKNKLHPQFRSFSEEDLCISEFGMLLSLDN